MVRRSRSRWAAVSRRQPRSPTGRRWARIQECREMRRSAFTGAVGCLSAVVRVGSTVWLLVLCLAGRRLEQLMIWHTGVAEQLLLRAWAASTPVLVGRGFVFYRSFVRPFGE